MKPRAIHNAVDAAVFLADSSPGQQTLRFLLDWVRAELEHPDPRRAQAAHRILRLAYTGQWRLVEQILNTVLNARPLLPSTAQRDKILDSLRRSKP